MTLPVLLVVRAQAGDRDALNRVLMQLQEPLYAHIVSVMGTRDAADDVLQEVLWTVARKIGSVRDPRWARAWAYRIANREAVRAAKRAKRYVAVTEELQDEETLPIAEPVFDESLISELRERLTELPGGAQGVVRLHYLDGLTLVEIAEALEVPLGTVKSRLAYGLKFLRQRIT